MPTRREFLATATAAMAAGTLGPAARAEDVKPNVLLIITDDQGYGDLGCLGNPVLKTPNLDRLYGESVRFTQFHVCPVCSPTRSSLMTGRYNYRTGVVDTFQGRSMMRTDETTLAEMLAAEGYATGIFGKWHLGDNYPMRACDRGFQESLVHKGGGICQPSEPRNNSYFDPILSHNGAEVKTRGYCTDIFADAAVAFIEANRARPFFAYFATNAPHHPHIVDPRYSEPYRKAGVDDETAKIYGMIANIDENVGRLLKTLEDLRIDQQTLVVFLTDNGPAFIDNRARYNAGMRAGKGTVYEGGIRVPCFFRWRGRLTPGRQPEQLAAHIDMAPTILDACGLPVPAKVQLDGKSLWPLATGASVDWPDRTLFFQWHRGDVPELYRDCTARNQRWKMVNGRELYDLASDPQESKDVSADHPEVLADLRRQYEDWFNEVCAKGFDPPAIVVGSPKENPTILTRQDWRGADGWHLKKDNVGGWPIDVERAGAFEVTLTVDPAPANAAAVCRFHGKEWRRDIPQGAAACAIDSVELEKGPGTFEAFIQTPDGRFGVVTAAVKRL